MPAVLPSFTMLAYKRAQGYFRKEATSGRCYGVNYMYLRHGRRKSYTTGLLQFASQQALDYLQIPPGKSDNALFLNGYLYGRLRYPIARNEHMRAASGNIVLASAITDNGEKYPAVALNTYGRGNVLYVNLPLGYLKAYSDGLPLQAFLAAFLFQTVKIPHLVNAEKGIGGLVINWHIDSSIEWTEIPAAINNKTLDKDLRYSIHITAGDSAMRQVTSLVLMPAEKEKHMQSYFCLLV